LERSFALAEKKGDLMEPPNIEFISGRLSLETVPFTQGGKDP
jgi:hypothetical protein